jgi:hypothetical protein
MLKFPALLNLSPTGPVQAAAVPTKKIDGLKHDHVWCFNAFFILTGPGFIVEFM